MSMIFFTYRARTQARQAYEILRNAGLPARLERTPSGIAGNGCGFGLRVPATYGKRASNLLRQGNTLYERSYLAEGGKMQEVWL